MEDNPYTQGPYQVWGAGPWAELMRRTPMNEQLGTDEYGLPITRESKIHDRYAGFAELAGAHEWGQKFRGGKHSFGFDDTKKYNKAIMQRAKDKYDTLSDEYKAENPLKDYISSNPILKAASEGALEYNDDYGMMIPDKEGNLVPLLYDDTYEGTGANVFSTDSVVRKGDKPWRASYLSNEYEGVVPQDYEAYKQKMSIDGQDVDKWVLRRGDDWKDEFEYDYGNTGLLGLKKKGKKFLSKIGDKFDNLGDKFENWKEDLETKITDKKAARLKRQQDRAQDPDYIVNKVKTTLGDIDKKMQTLAVTHKSPLNDLIGGKLADKNILGDDFLSYQKDNQTLSLDDISSGLDAGYTTDEYDAEMDEYSRAQVQKMDELTDLSFNKSRLNKYASKYAKDNPDWKERYSSDIERGFQPDLGAELAYASETGDYSRINERLSGEDYLNIDELRAIKTGQFDDYTTQAKELFDAGVRFEWDKDVTSGGKKLKDEIAKASDFIGKERADVYALEKKRYRDEALRQIDNIIEQDGVTSFLEDFRNKLKYMQR